MINNKQIEKIIIITAALPYANSSLHLGHLYSTFLPADLLNRSLKYLGKKTYFISGTDAHGTPILIQSIKTKTSCENILKSNHNMIKEQLSNMNIDLNLFSSTHYNIKHKTNVNNIAKKLFDEKKIFFKEVNIYFCTKCKIQLSDRLIEYYCEICKESFLIEEEKHNHKLINRCFACQSHIELIKSKELLMKYSKLNYKKLIEKCNINKAATQILKEIEKKDNHKDDEKVISRNNDFGIKINFFKERTFYVWFEALIGYLSFSNRYIDKKIEFKMFMGKDNVFFHTYMLSNIYEKKYWPSEINANHFLMFDNKKFSKTKNNGIFLKDIKKRETDVYRLFLISLLGANKNININKEEIKSFEKNIFIDRILNLFQRINKTFIHFKKIKLNNKFTNIQMNKFVELIINNDFQKAYKIFYKYVISANTQFNLQKVWLKKNNINIAEEWIEIAKNLLEFLDILTPKTSNIIRKYFVLEKNNIYLKICNKIYESSIA